METGRFRRQYLAAFHENVRDGEAQGAVPRDPLDSLILRFASAVDGFRVTDDGGDCTSKGEALKVSAAWESSGPLTALFPPAGQRMCGMARRTPMDPISPHP